MKHEGTRKADTRRKLISQASIRLRRDGLNAVGLRALVAEAGLTHGAFYAHFPSKAKLVEAAIEEALGETCARLLEAVSAVDSEKQLDAFVSAYLSELHWRSMDKGCMAAALGPEITRENHEMRAALARGLKPIVSLLKSLLPAGGDSSRRATRAETIFAGMVGALQLARLYEDANAANDFLAAARSNALIAAAQSWD